MYMYMISHICFQSSKIFLRNSRMWPTLLPALLRCVEVLLDEAAKAVISAVRFFRKTTVQIGDSGEIGESFRETSGLFHFS